MGKLIKSHQSSPKKIIYKPTFSIDLHKIEQVLPYGTWNHKIWVEENNTTICGTMTLEFKDKFLSQ